MCSISSSGAIAQELECGAGYAISKVVHATYGASDYMQGSCGQYMVPPFVNASATPSSCRFDGASAIRADCIGKQTCSVSASAFADNCVENNRNVLVVEAECKPTQALNLNVPNAISSMQKIGNGFCRTALMGSGTMLSKSNGVSLTECKNMCLSEGECVGIEWTKDNVCEIHTETLTTVKANSRAACFIKEPTGWTEPEATAIFSATPTAKSMEARGWKFCTRQTVTV